MADREKGGEYPCAPHSSQEAGESRKSCRWWPWTLLTAALTVVVIVLAILTPRWILNQVFLPANFDVKGNELHLYGELDSKSLGKFRELLEQNPGVSVLVLPSAVLPSATSDEGMDIAFGEEVRKRKLRTHLLETSTMFSTGMIVFMGGVNRTMEAGAMILLHSWHTSNGTDMRDLPRSSPEHRTHLRYFKEMLGAEGFYWFYIDAAHGDDFYEMTKKEIDKYGLLTGRIG